MTKYTNEISQTNRPVDEATIKRIEKRLKITFPEEIRQHYLTFNGGVPARTWFENDDFDTLFGEFLPIVHGRRGDTVETVCEDLCIEQKVIPRFLVPFAADQGGDYFCFSVKADEPGAIYFFNGEHYDEPDACIRVADSLREFIEGLKEDVDDDDDD